MKKNQLNQKFILGILIVFLIIYLDLITKNLVFFYLHNTNYFNNSLYPVKPITSFFSLVYVNNNGISFGMFNSINYARETFSILQSSIAFALVFWMYKVKNFYMVLALALIIGGAFGNVFDRLQNGGVTDFLDFHIFNYHWPAFNLADSVIFIGVAIILFDEFILKKYEKK
ncbi:MAG: signal peptidase II [Alphaproteobacteria bacterium]